MKFRCYKRFLNIEFISLNGRCRNKSAGQVAKNDKGREEIPAPLLTTEKLVSIGEYKSLPNNVETSKGIFQYTTPDQLDSLNKFFGTALINSLELYFKAAKGDKLLNSEDLQNRILLLTKKLEDNYMRVPKSNKIMASIIQTTYSQFLFEVDNRLKMLNHIFVDREWLYFEEPKPPKYGIPTTPLPDSLPQILNHFIGLAPNGRSYHQFKAMNWLYDLRNPEHPTTFILITKKQKNYARTIIQNVTL